MEVGKLPEKPKADMKAAALKAWQTRREKYGESGLSKTEKKPEKEGEQVGKVATKRKEKEKGKAKKDSKTEELETVISKESENPSD